MVDSEKFVLAKNKIKSDIKRLIEQCQSKYDKSQRNLLNKWFQDSVKNYFLEQFAAPLIVEYMQLQNVQEVRSYVHSQVDTTEAKFMNLIGTYFLLLQQFNQVAKFKQRLLELVFSTLEIDNTQLCSKNYNQQKLIRKQFVGLIILFYCIYREKNQIHNSFYDIWNILFPYDKVEKKKLTKYDVLRNGKVSKKKINPKSQQCDSQTQCQQQEDQSKSKQIQSEENSETKAFISKNNFFQENQQPQQQQQTASIIQTNYSTSNQQFNENKIDYFSHVKKPIFRVYNKNQNNYQNQIQQTGPNNYSQVQQPQIEENRNAFNPIQFPQFYDQYPKQPYLNEDQQINIPINQINQGQQKFDQQNQLPLNIISNIQTPNDISNLKMNQYNQIFFYQHQNNFQHLENHQNQGSIFNNNNKNNNLMSNLQQQQQKSNIKIEFDLKQELPQQEYKQIVQYPDNMKYNERNIIQQPNLMQNLLDQINLKQEAARDEKIKAEQVISQNKQNKREQNEIQLQVKEEFQLNQNNQMYEKQYNLQQNNANQSELQKYQIKVEQSELELLDNKVQQKEQLQQLDKKENIQPIIKKETQVFEKKEQIEKKNIKAEVLNEKSQLGIQNILEKVSSIKNNNQVKQEYCPQEINNNGYLQARVEEKPQNTIPSDFAIKKYNENQLVNQKEFRQNNVKIQDVIQSLEPLQQTPNKDQQIEIKTEEQDFSGSKIQNKLKLNILSDKKFQIKTEQIPTESSANQINFSSLKQLDNNHSQQIKIEQESKVEDIYQENKNYEIENGQIQKPKKLKKKKLNDQSNQQYPKNPSQFILQENNQIISNQFNNVPPYSYQPQHLNYQQQMEQQQQFQAYYGNPEYMHQHKYSQYQVGMYDKQPMQNTNMHELQTQNQQNYQPNRFTLNSSQKQIPPYHQCNGYPSYEEYQMMMNHQRFNQQHQIFQQQSSQWQQQQQQFNQEHHESYNSHPQNQYRQQQKVVFKIPNNNSNNVSNNSNPIKIIIRQQDQNSNKNE